MPAEHPNIEASFTQTVSLRDILINIIRLLRYILQKWFIVLLAVIVFAILGFIYSKTYKAKYEAALTFILEESKSNPLASYAGIASQFGIDLGGSSGEGVFVGDNILTFLKTRLMVQRTLLLPINTNGKVVSMADRFLDISGLRNKWQKDPGVKDITFPVKGDAKLSIIQDSALNVIYQVIIAKHLTASKPDKKLAFIEVKFISEDQLFAKQFVENLVSQATSFYVQTKTKRSKTSVDYLQRKADSLEVLLDKKTYAAATMQDLNQNPARRVALVSAEVAGRDKIILQTMYGEVIKNLEMSKVALSQETPIIQIIDTPILPLKKIQVGLVKGVVIGGLLGGILCVIVLTVSKLLKSYLRDFDI
ncbi:Wzz/FepE/Etk N-terminal domain-containing protein [Chitinophaga sp. 22536]|uniref:Wzz/FepE/Etk N-terminal domain-containing protein n=1 Tax=unclassified Chitinophaga TaxID=2619133 RepID=UPI003F83F98C